ncbi:ATP-binding protein [Sinorhizobium sp. BG8]|uniref:ATP-binding protein n=1 Tax=Sinorhizobium sp. BG8 TaxID=2613773 RepID=UPI00193DF818|nr:ATP-binding protein [Sinorhizobium sp. BG8]QRM54284.1 PAS domain S-box protein [Sinorhizobium sp. BG8]
MSSKQYPFIDVAVHERVRVPFSRGEAVVLFSSDLHKVLWSNGRGADLFGHSSIYDFLDAGAASGDVAFRQLQATARQLRTVGDARTFMMRIGVGFRSLPVNARVEMIAVGHGEKAILLSAPIADAAETPTERAEAMISGFDDPDTHMAVLGADGEIIACSEGFPSLAMSEETRRFLVGATGRHGGWLVKRPVATGKGRLPAAIGRVSADPALHLLFAVETIIGNLDAGAELYEEGASIPHAPVQADASPAAASTLPEPAPVAVDQVEPPAQATVEFPAADIAEEPQHTFMESVEETPADDGGKVPHTSTEEAKDEHAEETGVEWPVTMAVEDQLPAAADPVAETRATAEPAGAGTDGFVFNRSGRPIRFVWKIDAQGRFSEISEEFALAVGPHAAAIIGEAFTDVAGRYDLDPGGKISDLLRRRDTWSGKTILWPVENTDLAVPVDLAALPTYSRNREFDGFRGFGIVRVADAVENPNQSTKRISPNDAVAPIAAAETAGDEIDTAPASALVEPVSADEFFAPEPEAGATTLVEASESPVEGELPDQIDAEQTAETGEEALSAASGEQPEAGGDAQVTESRPEDDDTAEAQPDDAFRGERPALRLVEPSRRRNTDKVVQFEQRRFSSVFEGLSSGEQAAFREIARQLGETFGKRKPEDLFAGKGADEQVLPTGKSPPEAAADTAVSAENTETVAKADVSAPADALQEGPGLEVGDHADDMLPAADEGAIARVHTGSRYGLTTAVADALPVALLVHAGDRLIHANPEFLKLSGYQSLDTLAEAGGLGALLDGHAEESEQGPDGTMTLRHADGEKTISVRARLRSIQWEDSSALMLALTPVQAATAPSLHLVQQSPAMPAEEERNAEQRAIAALRVEADELRSILETATDGVVVVGQDGEIRSMNRSASALFNYDEEETRGKPFAMLFAHESQKAVLDYLAGLAGHGVASVLNDGREVIGREASGGFIPLFMTMGRLSSSSGYCAVIRDITQWKRTEEELRNAKRAAETANAHKSDFLARVSHEIRTPLNAIIGFSDMMATERFGPIGHSRYVEYANDIGRSGRHVLDIVNDLLDISKIEAGEMDLEFTAVGLNEIVSEAVSLVQPQANSQRVIIRTSLSTAVPQVVADQRSVKQIALNILANAIRFTPSGGQIVVSTAYEPSGSVVLRIRDTGVGMTRAELEQAMKPFRQVTTGARNRGEGTGLGLPLTKAMVDANRASFSISSAPNEGTLVEVIFPSPRVLAG